MKSITHGCRAPKIFFLYELAVSGICAVGILESLYGLFQVLGWRRSWHALYALTGHFQNPGPFGGFIACVMAVAGAWLLHSRPEPRSMAYQISSCITTVLAWTALAAGFLVLPASMSRAGWLGLAVALGIEWLRFRVKPGMTQFSRHAGLQSGIFWAGGIVLCFGLLAGAFALKPDSALGRLHVWRMECGAIAERPWWGAGPGMGPWAYGEAQEAFFREHLETVSPAVVRVAGCPEYAFNEFLGFGVEYGVPALLLSVLIVVSSILVLHRANSPFAAGLTAWAVFACASYPLSVPQLRIFGAIFILGAIVAGILQTACSGRRFAGLLPGIFVILLVGWMMLLGLPAALGLTDRERFRELYSEGYALHQAGRYGESTEVLKKGTLLSCDPMFEIILGKNAEALGDIDRAKELYEKAHYMVPSRLYPLVRMMRLQIRRDMDEAALETARQIVSMPVNERNTGMVRLHKETEITLDSLTNILRTDGQEESR